MRSTHTADSETGLSWIWMFGCDDQNHDLKDFMGELWIIGLL